MNPDVFFKNFELLADAPNGVKKLRELILQLAVRGKLVSRDLNDEPASVLVEKMKAEKKKLIREKTLRADSFTQIEEDEILFKIPNYWEWVRLGQIGEWGAGSTPNRGNSDYFGGTIKWFKSGELNDGYIIDSEEKITDLALKDCSLRLNKKGDVLIAMYGATIGKIGILDAEATTNQAVCACTCFTGVYNRYLFFLLKAYKPYFTSQGAGGAQPNISRIKIVNTVVPLPPLAEQKRIVSKVDELMTLCDKLETRRQKKQELQSKLNNAALDRMLRAENQEEFESHWQRICENFDLLYDNPENVGKLKQAILQLAVQGRLVEQNPEDESASVLIEKVEAEKKRCIVSKEIQDDKKLSPIMKETPPWIIPPSWKWIRLQEIFEITRGASPRPAGDPQYFGGDIPWITVREITKDSAKYLTKTSDFLTELGSKRSRYIHPSDLLLTNSGATLGVPKISKIKGCINDGVARLNCFHDLISKDYVYYYLFQQTQAFREVNQGMGQPNLNTSILAGWFLPLPPLEEQKRIVEKIEQLMGLCDELELKLRKEREDRGKLMETVVRGLLEGAAAEK